MARRPIAPRGDAQTSSRERALPVSAPKSGSISWPCVFFLLHFASAPRAVVRRDMITQVVGPMTWTMLMRMVTIVNYKDQEFKPAQMGCLSIGFQI